MLKFIRKNVHCTYFIPRLFLEFLGTIGISIGQKASSALGLICVSEVTS